MEQLKQMKEALAACASSQINGNMDKVDAKELGEVVDMIKDLAEASYYCTITEAMEKKYDGGQEPEKYYYTQRMRPMTEYVDPYMGKMYYDTQPSEAYRMGGGRTGYYTPDYRMKEQTEGRSPMYRRMYMEGKMKHEDIDKQMKELETYMEELSHDLTEMIQDTTPEEKQMIQEKIIKLANKIK